VSNKKTSKENTSEIGYKKPPKSGQFKKGQSGNPNGRPKGSKNLGKLLEDILNGKVTVRDGDTTRQMGAMEAMLHSIAVKAMKGDIRAFKEITRLMNEDQAKQLASQQSAETTPQRTGVLVVPPVLTAKAWDMLYGSNGSDGMIELSVVRELYDEMLKVGMMVKGVGPIKPKKDD
jgi:hypothetical protein